MSDRDPRSFNLPEGETLTPDHIDNVGRALISLLREVAVLSDRVLVMTELHERGERVSHEAIDSFVPDDAFNARSQAAMQKIVGSILTSLRGGDA